MATYNSLTTEQVSVLLWLKVLNEYSEDGYANSTFNEKYEDFEAVEDTGLSRVEYESAVNFWVANKILSKDNESDELSISKQGKKLFKLIEEQGDKTEPEIKEILQAKLEQTPLDSILDTVKEHWQEIIPIISVCLQGVDIFINIIQ